MLAPLFGILSTTFIVTSLILVREQDSIILDQAKSQADMMANTLLSSLKTMMLAGDALYADDWLQRVRNHPEMKQVEILRRDGSEAFRDLHTVRQVNAFLGKPRFDRKAQSPTVPADVPASSLVQAAAGQTVTLQDHNQLTFLLPIHKDAQCNACHGYDPSPIRGVLRLTVSTDNAIQRVAQTGLRITLIATGAMLVLGWLSYLIIRRRIITPIDQMRQATTEIAEGNLLARVDTNSRDEIAELGDDFNRMTESLQQTTVSKQYVEKIIHSLGDMLFVTNASGIIIMSNPAATQSLGFEADELAGKKVTEIIVEGLLNRREIETIETGGIIRSIDRKVVTKSGEIIPVMISVSMLATEQHQHQIIYAARDITQQKVAERQLRLAAKVMNTVSNGIIVADADARIRLVNPAFTAITGYQPEDVIGRNPRIFQSGRHDQAFYRDMWEKILGLGYWEGEIWNKRKDGEIYPEWLTITSMRDDDGDITHFVSTFVDISEEKRIHNELEYLANHDLLTGLPNRKLFIDRIEHALHLAKRAGNSAALLFIDIDGFKPVNDTYGHDIGDKLLKAIAARLRTCVRESDTVARIGGDEFTVFMENIADMMNVMPVSEKILAAMMEPFEFGDIRCQVGASIGISRYPDDGDNLNDLVKRADTAMYRAKSAGRNRIRVAGDEGNGGYVI